MWPSKLILNSLLRHAVAFFCSVVLSFIFEKCSWRLHVLWLRLDVVVVTCIIHGMNFDLLCTCPIFNFVVCIGIACMHIP